MNAPATTQQTAPDKVRTISDLGAFLGKRGTPAALHAYLHRLAAAHQEPR